MLKITFIIQRGVGYWLPCLWWPLLATLLMRNWSPLVTSADKKGMVTLVMFPPVKIDHHWLPFMKW
jgi:hypothetical protein